MPRLKPSRMSLPMAAAGPLKVPTKPILTPFSAAAGTETDTATAARQASNLFIHSSLKHARWTLLIDLCQRSELWVESQLM